MDKKQYFRGNLDLHQVDNSIGAGNAKSGARKAAEMLRGGSSEKKSDTSKNNDKK